MESGSKEEHPNSARCVNPAANTQHGGNQLYYSQFIMLGPSKDREARANTLKRCAIASTLGPLEATPEVAEGILREVYNFEYPWKAVPLGARTFLIEFPSISLLEKAAIGQVLFGSNNALAVRKWQENIGAYGTLQRFWVRVRGLPRESWVWDDVNGILEHFCVLEKIEYIEATKDSRDYVRALVAAAGPEYFPIFARVCINTKLHNVYVHAETGQSMNPSVLPTKYVNPGFTPGSPDQSQGKPREIRMKRGYVVGNHSGEPTGTAIQSMSCTGPFLPNSLESYSKKIGASCLSREGCGKDEINPTGKITGLVRKRNNEGNQGITLHLSK